jgi:hypothetical protein
MDEAIFRKCGGIWVLCRENCVECSWGGNTK